MIHSSRSAQGSPGRPAEGSVVFLDACCLINLFASGRIEEILRQLPFRCATSRLIADEEVLSIKMTGTSEKIQPELVSAGNLEAFGRLSVVEVATEDERREFDRFADDLDHGEASVCALAVAHHGGVATDDRKALRMLAGMAPQVPTLSTPELLFEWARRSRASEVEISAVLRAIRDRGSFYPRRGSPHFEWWVAHMKEPRR